jgi:hypothetical protein
MPRKDIYKDGKPYQFKKNDPRINRKGAPVLPNIKEAIAKGVDTEKVIEALAKKAYKGDVRAAQELFDRGYGRPQQYVDLSNKGDKFDFSNINTDELIGRIEKLIGRKGKNT